MQPPGNAAIVLVHPNALMLEGIEKLLEATPYEVAACAATAEALNFDEISRRGKVIVLAGGPTPARIQETVRNIRNELDSAHILVMGATSEPRDVMATLEAGADGYLSETITFRSLVRVMKLVLGHATVLPLNFVKTLARLSGNSSEETDDRGIDAAANEGGERRNRKSGGVEGDLFELLRGPGSESSGQRIAGTPAANREKVDVRAVIRWSGGIARPASVWVAAGRLRIFSRRMAARKES